ncbi:p-hydroxycinnamoyl CoA hydratase/lyase [Thermodesulfobacteriota bacterium]
MNDTDKLNPETNVSVPGGKDILVEFDNRIAWVIMNRPKKRNAMSPAFNKEMLEVLDTLEVDDRCGVLVLTGAGEAWSSGMDIKEYFRDVDNATPIEMMRVRREAFDWQWRRLAYYPKPTIAMVNGWCFGGAFTPLVACDLAIAADDAVFGLSEINWGIIPAGGVPRAMAATMNQRDALYYIMTGETFDGQRAAQMGLVNESVPRDQLRERVIKLAASLLEKSPTILNAAKIAFKHLQHMTYDSAFDYIGAKAMTASSQDPERGRKKGMKQFLDEKTYRPGLGIYSRDE